MSSGMVADLYAVLGLRPDEASWKRGNELIGGVKQALAFFAGYEAVRGVTEIVKSAIDLGGHLDDLRQKTGLSAESLQQWGFAAKLGGSDMDAFAHATGHLARTIKEATGGSADAATALNQVGLSGKTLTEALKGGDGLDAALLEISSKFADMPDGPKKTALAMALFGKSGAELIPTLNQGAQGLTELREEAIALGVVLGEDTVSAADALGDNIDKLKMSVRGLLNNAIAAMIPTLQGLVDGMLDWIKANKQLAIDTLTKGVDLLIKGLHGVATIAGVVGHAIGWLTEHTQVARAIFIALGVVIGAVALEAAAAWLVAFWPVALVAAAIAGVILLVDKLWDAFHDGKGTLADVGRYIANEFHKIVDSITGALGQAKDVFSAINSSISDAFHAVIDWITAKIDWCWEQLRKIGSALQKAGRAVIGSSVDAAVGGANTFTNPVVPTTPSAGGQQVNVNGGDFSVTINAQSANADEVGQIIDDKIKEHHDKTWRDVHAATGGADVNE